MDIIGPIYQKIQNGELMVKPDGKIHANTLIAVHTPWVQINPDPSRNCGHYLDIMFGCYGVMHSRCLNCYKVVIKPKTLFNLVWTEAMLRDFPYSAKCGLELRDYVYGIYGAYVYFDSIEEGQKAYEVLKGKTEDQIILKRGCTEYERAFGPSDQWQDTTNEALQKRIDELFVYEGFDAPQPDYVQDFIRSGWWKQAYAWGDPSLANQTHYVNYQKGETDEEEVATGCSEPKT